MVMYQDQTVLQMFYRWEREKRDEIYLRQPVNRQWRNYTWGEVGEQSRRMAASLRAMDLPSGSRIGLLSKNCAHWFMVDLAIMMSGHVSVPLFPQQTAESLRYILEHSETKVLFTGKLDTWEHMEPGIPGGIRRIALPYPGMDAPETWDEVIAAHEPLDGETQRAMDEIATIVYTSGTTGHPKGVVHTYANVAYAVTHIKDTLDLSAEDRAISYLPLSHVTERVVVEFLSIYGGSCVAFAESRETFLADVQIVQPDLFISVPRLWTLFQKEILRKLPQRKLDRLLRIPIVAGLVKKKIRRGLGLGRARMLFTGSAPTFPSLLAWYAKVGLPVQEGYGMTENLIYTSVTRPGNIRFGSVGQPYPNVEIKIEDTGEILVKCACLMRGYYKNPEQTAEVIKDGYYHTGDVGHLDADGFLFITGRIKETFKTAKGKFVQPTPIEKKLAFNDDIEQVCVIGLGMNQPVALVRLTATAGQAPRAEMSARLLDHMRSVNGELLNHERLDAIYVVKDEWTPENGLLTPTLKVVRAAVLKRYEAWVQREGVKGDVLFET